MPWHDRLCGTTFHAQQCAEKYLKALLTAQGQGFPRTHDLIALGDLCLRNGIIVPVDQESLQRLAAYAVQARYPGEDPGLDEAQEALQTAQAMRRAIGLDAVAPLLGDARWGHHPTPEALLGQIAVQLVPTGPRFVDPMQFVAPGLQLANELVEVTWLGPDRPQEHDLRLTLLRDTGD